MKLSAQSACVAAALAFCSAPPAAPAAQRPADRPLLSRSELWRLKKLDRAQVFAALGSFDDRGLADDAFILRTGELLDTGRIPGLGGALAARDAPKTLDAVVRACRPRAAATGRTAVSPSVRGAADDVLAHRFSFYGETHQLPPSIDWDQNPGTAHWGHDLNRFAYLDALTRTCLATDDPRYGAKAIGLILDWIAKSDLGKCFTGTPYMFGSYLNNASHCVAWTKCVQTLLARDQVRPIDLLRILKSIHDQLAYLEIVTNGHGGNWPVIGCGAMLECAASFPALRDAPRFADYAARTIKTQILDQVKPDGVQDELTPHYHRVVVNILLSIIPPLRSLGRDLDPDTLATLHKMIRYIQQTTVPDGSKQVAFNDSDPGAPGGIAAQLARLGLGELLSPPDTLGPECFPYAGVALLRRRQDRGDLYLAFDAGPYGRSHQHEDKLGFWLFAFGRNIIVDPGRHLYDHSARSYYDYLKSTTAHSTIRIDGQDQHSAGGRDTWIPTQPLDLGWRVHERRETRARGVYELGYGPRNEINVTHRREIVFVEERLWVVFDSITGAGEHLVESRFQFAPGNLVLANGAAHTTFPDANLLLHPASSAPFTDSRVECGREDPRAGWYSDSYGRIEPAPALSLSVRTPLPLRVATLLLPYRGTQAPETAVALDGRHAIIRVAGAPNLRVESTLP